MILSEGTPDENRSARLILGLPNFGAPPGSGAWTELLDIAERAETAGFDGVSVFDHLVLTKELRGHPGGGLDGNAASPWLDPLITLAAIAGRTAKIRLFTSILIAPLRPAVLLAKMAATLDQLSGGRLELGVGTGWLPAEYESVGLPFAARGALLDDALEVCRLLWRGGPSTYSSQHVNFTDIYCSPLPIQSLGVPFWIGGALHERNIGRIVAHGRGWMPGPSASSDDIVIGSELLRNALATKGRDPDALRVRITVMPPRDTSGRLDLRDAFDPLPGILRRTGRSDVLVVYPLMHAGHAPDRHWMPATVNAFTTAVEAI